MPETHCFTYTVDPTLLPMRESLNEEGFDLADITKSLNLIKADAQANLMCNPNSTMGECVDGRFET